MKLVIVGGGFTGAAVARRAREAGFAIVATTRSDARAASLRSLGVTPLVTPVLTAESLAPYVDGETRVLVTMPPDGTTDAAIATPLARVARSIAYVSSTGVYGDAQGRVDEETQVNPTTPRASARLDGERIWQGAGASIVRAPGIYGPGRGMHLRLARGELRLAEGTNTISRIHVDDLAAALFALLARGVRGALYVTGDHEPAPHADVVRFLCDALALPMPPRMAAEEADESLRNDRRVDASRILEALSLTLAYPNYRAGYTQCIEADRAPIDAAIRDRNARAPAAD